MKICTRCKTWSRRMSRADFEVVTTQIVDSYTENKISYSEIESCSDDHLLQLFFIGKAITVLETGLVLNTHGKVLSGETAGNTHGSLVKGLCSCELGELASSWASISKSLKIETASSQLSPGKKRLSPSHEGKLPPQHHCRGMAKTFHLNHTSKGSPPYCWLLDWKQNFLFCVNYSEHKMHQI